MKCLFSLNEFKRRQIVSPIITWGVFDGVHRGHQKIINELIRQARQYRGTSVILTFRNHPDKVLSKPYPPDITSLTHRFQLLKQSGADFILVYPFNQRFSQIKPEDFIKKILVNQLKVRGIVVGQDTRFGKHRTGNLRLLQQLSKRYGLHLTIVRPLKYRGRIISSTRIRQSIQQDKLSEAAAMLGRPVSLAGRVVPGTGRGKRLGFPTANLEILHELIPPHGVYTSQVQLNGQVYRALTNIGLRPTFKELPHSRTTRPTVETYLIGLRRPENLYGKELVVRLLERIRGERKFRTPTELVRQIKQDEAYLRGKNHIS